MISHLKTLEKEIFVLLDIVESNPEWDREALECHNLINEHGQYAFEYYLEYRSEKYLEIYHELSNQFIATIIDHCKYFNKKHLTNYTKDSNI